MRKLCKKLKSEEEGKQESDRQFEEAPSQVKEKNVSKEVHTVETHKSEEENREDKNMETVEENRSVG